MIVVVMVGGAVVIGGLVTSTLLTLLVVPLLYLMFERRQAERDAVRQVTGDGDDVPRASAPPLAPATGGASA